MRAKYNHCTLAKPEIISWSPGWMHILILYNYSVAGIHGCISWNSKYFLELSKEAYEKLQDRITPFAANDDDDEK